MELVAVLLPVMAFIALTAGLVVIFRGTARIAARTREVHQFRGGVKEIASKIDATLAAATSRIDEVRHHVASAETIVPTVTDASEALERYGDAARALGGPRHARAIRDDFIAEIERASRALGMVEHGANVLSASRRGSRDLEAQTSIKRGYLNLIHAREAIARHALRADDLAVEDAATQRPPFSA